MFDQVNLNRLAYFAAVVDAGSFTKAAERLGITKAVVSQQVAALEADLRTTLLVRTTRRMHPTEAGVMFHARCTQILREAEEAISELAATQDAPSGTLRLTAPNDYGISRVMPVVSAFTSRFPDCRVEVLLGDQTQDLLEGQIDMAIRVGWLADSSLQARKISDFRQVLVSAPGFARPSHPRDLAALPFVANLALREPLRWVFIHADGPYEVTLSNRIAVDTTLGVLEAVRLGCGLSILPDFLVAEDLMAGRLTQVLPEWHLRIGGIHAVFPPARFRPTKVACFVDMLVVAEKGRQPHNQQEITP
jgi:DNA-binding transcriptional LysR family regulator